jgi:thiamine transport system substrate-binding protein
MIRFNHARTTILSAGVMAALLAACGGTPATPTALPPTTAPASTAASAPTATNGEVRTLTVMTHDSFAASEEVLKSFEQANNVKLNILKSGDAGSALNKAILAKGNPLADVFYGVDNTFLSRALEAGIFEPYAVTGSAPAAEFQLDKANPPSVTAVDYGDVCINYDKAYFKAKNLTAPQTLEDLIKPEYKGLLVIENPATSSPGLAFMLATVAHFGADKFLDYWKQLKANDVKVVDGWETAYNTDFSGSAGKGARPLVVSYASSPPAEVIFAQTPPAEAPTASVVGDGACFRQIEFAGVLKGARNPELARKFVDFLLSVPFQEDMPLQMFVFPVVAQAKLPDAFTQWAQIPKAPATLPPEDIAKNRDAWIQQWTESVMR